MEVTGQLQARPLALGGGGGPAPNEKAAGGAVCGRDKILAPTGSRTIITLTQLVPSYYSDYNAGSRRWAGWYNNILIKCCEKDQQDAHVFLIIYFN
jgi:hypothetical protein